MSHQQSPYQINNSFQLIDTEDQKLTESEGGILFIQKICNFFFKERFLLPLSEQ